jgi:hypothetical protein
MVARRWTSMSGKGRVTRRPARCLLRARVRAMLRSMRLPWPGGARVPTTALGLIQYVLRRPRL